MSNIKRIEFFNREKEKEEIMNILKVEPQLINFIYGPINSGKTTLITNLIEELSDEYVVFYINLRRKSITKYEDFIKVLFSVEKNKDLKEIMRGLFAKVEKAIYVSQGIPINDSLLDGFLKKDSNEDVFAFLENYFKEISKTKIPLLIIDELQLIGNLEIDGKLIYRLFNFFIGLTKELHICHVFALSSDSLFIERVYSEAMLEGRANYILVDDFDEETTMKFLEKYKFNEKEQNIVWKYAGGKASLINTLITKKLIGENIENIEKYLNEEIIDTLGKIKQRIYVIKNIGVNIEYEKTKIKIEFERVLEMLNKFSKDECYSYSAITPEINYLVSQNILFVDPRSNITKPQSRINLIAIRKVLKKMK